jgi:hypothetical protein
MRVQPRALLDDIPLYFLIFVISILIAQYFLHYLFSVCFAFNLTLRTNIFLAKMGLLCSVFLFSINLSISRRRRRMKSTKKTLWKTNNSVRLILGVFPAFPISS